MTYYAWLIVATIIGPLALSFDKKVAFYKTWKFLLPSIGLMALVFIGWDVFFTQKGIWGFNSTYVSSSKFFGLPIEEILFFIVVPFACMFIYEVVKTYFEKYALLILGRGLAFGIGLGAFILTISFLERWYTLVACGMAFMLVVGFYFKSRVIWFSKFSLAFIIGLLPFLIINGALTGMFTEQPVVWYNEAHFSGIRIGTIPLEDLFYNFDLLLLITWIYEKSAVKRSK